MGASDGAAGAILAGGSGGEGVLCDPVRLMSLVMKGVWQVAYDDLEYEDDPHEPYEECEFCGMVNGHEPDCECRPSYDISDEEELG
jgi:hypothetical protein